jgi:hypothetical protein
MMDGTDLVTNPPAFLKAYTYTPTSNVPFMEINTSDLNVAGSHTFELYARAYSGPSAMVGFSVVL